MAFCVCETISERVAGMTTSYEKGSFFVYQTLYAHQNFYAVRMCSIMGEIKRKFMCEGQTQHAITK